VVGERVAPLAGEAAAAAGGGAKPLAAGPAPADLAAVLVRALSALGESIGAERVAAWGRDEGGALRVLAARVEGAQLPPPNEAAWAALAALAGPTDLGAAGSLALEALAAEHGFSAAAPLHAGADGVVAVLLLGSSRDRAGAVRPRVLAALGSAAARSLAPAAAAQAAQRLARLDGEVQRLDRLAAVGGLLAEIVHEVRNPLVSIKTFLHLLGEEDAGRAGEFREVAIDELRRIERLLEVLMQHARPPSPRSDGAIGEIEPALRSTAQLATLRAAGRNISVEVALAEDVPPARIAPDALRQVLLNLALNAIEASDAGGKVRLLASAGAAGVTIAVEDDGPGVPEALRGRLFEPFFSTKARAGGLGLAITRRLVEEAGGSIALADVTPHGSRFEVTLPLARA
jgi:signal transduction histidine kinase